MAPDDTVLPLHCDVLTPAGPRNHRRRRDSPGGHRAHAASPPAPADPGRAAPAGATPDTSADSSEARKGRRRAQAQRRALLEGLEILRRARERTGIGVNLEDPPIDYATMAKGLGVASFGPISDPKDLGPTLQRALEVVESGEPALVDVLTQPR